MPSPRLLVASLPAALLVLACPASPPAGDEADASESIGESETDTATDTGASELCDPPRPLGDALDHSIAIDDVGLDVGEDVDLAELCTIADDGDAATLRLDCPGFTFALSDSGPASAGILDLPGASVLLRFIQASSWNYASQWLRLDYLGEQLSVFWIDAETLEPASGWANPWSLAVGQECLANADIDQYAQSLVLAREGDMLELWQGEAGQLGGDALEVWVDRSLRDGPDAPPGDGPTSWKELVIVSRGQLAGGEVCDPAMDGCGPGLACCYPCGVPDCDYVCQAEDPATMECPPPPP